MDANIIHIVGENELGSTVFNEIVGPVTLAEATEWLMKNGFSKPASTLTHRDGDSYFHHLGVSVSPLATTAVYAKVIPLHNPSEVVVNSDPNI